MTPGDFKKGERVRYVPSHAFGDVDHKDCENGVVSSTNSRFVFVKYDNAMCVMVTGDEPYTAQATRSCRSDKTITRRKTMKRIVLFDVSGSVVTESRIFERAYAALMGVFAEHYKDEITVLAFSHITIEIEDLADLRLGNVRGFGQGSDLAQGLRFAAAYKPDVVTIITDDAPGFQGLREFPFFHHPTALDVRFLTVASELVQPDLLALVVRNGGTICRA